MAHSWRIICIDQCVVLAPMRKQRGGLLCLPIPSGLYAVSRWCGGEVKLRVRLGLECLYVCIWIELELGGVFTHVFFFFPLYSTKGKARTKILFVPPPGLLSPPSPPTRTRTPFLRRVCRARTGSPGPIFGPIRPRIPFALRMNFIASRSTVLPRAPANSPRGTS